MKCCIVSRLIATESWRICCLPCMHPTGIISSRFSFFPQVLSPQTVSFAKAKLFSSSKSVPRLYPSLPRLQTNRGVLMKGDEYLPR